MSDRPPAGVILAGGEGRRLRGFVRGLVGDERPKQVCPVVGPETLLAQTRRRAAVLVEPARAVLTLRDVEGFGNEEVADMLGASVACVKSRLHRARMALREHLTRYWASTP